MSTFHLRLEYGTYTHRCTVDAEDQDQAIAIAWSRLAKRGLLTLPMAYQAAHVERVES